MLNDGGNISVDLMSRYFIFVLRNICIQANSGNINDVNILVGEMMKFDYMFGCFEDEIKLFCIVLLYIGHMKENMFDTGLGIVGLFKNSFDLFELYDVTYEYRDYSEITNAHYFGSIEIDKCIDRDYSDVDYNLYQIVSEMILTKDIPKITKFFNLFGTKQQNIDKIKALTKDYRIVAKGKMFKILKTI